jgi:hypothetical protein
MVHHVQVYGEFAEAVGDYSEKNIFERLKSPEAQLLSQIVDPYRYFNNGRFEIPKLMLNSAGDEFFVSDSSQFYFHDLPGEDNYLRYFPNTGHGLNASAAISTIAFADAVVNNRHLPDFSWTVETDGSIHVHTIDAPSQVLLWQTTNPTARDFRNTIGGVNQGHVWTAQPLFDQGGGTYIATVPTPANGATAFLVELTFPSPNPNYPYVFTTDVRVNTNLPLYPWPYPEPAGLASTSSDGGLIVSANLYVPPRGTLFYEYAVHTLPSVDAWIVTSTQSDVPPAADADSSLASAYEQPADSPAHGGDEPDDITSAETADEEAADMVFDAHLDEVLA